VSADIHIIGDEWRALGATLLPSQLTHGGEIRCSLRTGGYFIEIGQYRGYR
jgi:hypothetical protein